MLFPAKLGECKARVKYDGAANKSLDVSAKQRLFLASCVVNSNGLGGGFAPRHL